jgi:hypothetical protein
MFSLANQKKQTRPKNLNKRKKTLQPEKLKRKTKSKYQERNIQIKQDTGHFQTKKSSKIYVKSGVINCSKTMPKWCSKMMLKIDRKMMLKKWL